MSVLLTYQRFSQPAQCVSVRYKQAGDNAVFGHIYSLL